MFQSVFHSHIMKTFLVLLFAASTTLAVKLDIKPYQRLIPADVLRGTQLPASLFPVFYTKYFMSLFVEIFLLVLFSKRGIRRPVCSYLKVKVPLGWKLLNSLLSSFQFTFRFREGMNISIE